MNLLLLIIAVLFLFGSHKRPLYLAGVIAALVYLTLRGISLGRLPLVGPHDTLTFFSVSIGIMGLPFLLARPVKKYSSFPWSIGLLAGSVSLLALIFPPYRMPLPPILRTYWFELHVSLAFFAYALFGIAALLGLFFLKFQERQILDLQYRAALVGFTFFSASMVAGGIWGYYAWGTYWLWTPKELWTTILWLFYSFYLHLRLQGKEWDRIVAWAGIIGFGMTLFTYLGVSLLMRSSHSF